VTDLQYLFYFGRGCSGTKPKMKGRKEEKKRSVECSGSRTKVKVHFNLYSGPRSGGQSFMCVVVSNCTIHWLNEAKCNIIYRTTPV
jgi:hypothetical protein